MAEDPDTDVTDDGTEDETSHTSEEAKARAEKLRAQAEQIRANTKAQLERQRAQIRKDNAEATKAEADACVAQMNLGKARREEAETLAANKYYHTYYLNDSINSSAVAACMNQLNIWDRNDPKCEVTVIFNSPGGSVIDGMALFDTIMEFRAKGHKVTTRALGYAASMAGILLQVGEVRQIGNESYLLIHEVAAGTSGKIGEIQDEVKFLEMISNRVLNIFARRAKVSRSFIKRQWRRTDWWLNSDQALEYGIVDEIIGNPQALTTPEKPCRKGN